MKDKISLVVKRDGSIQYEYSFSDGMNFGCHSVEHESSVGELVGILRSLQFARPSATVTILFEQ